MSKVMRYGMEKKLWHKTDFYNLTWTFRRYALKEIIQFYTTITVWIPDKLKQIKNRNKVDVVVFQSDKQQTNPGIFTIEIPSHPEEPR